MSLRAKFCLIPFLLAHFNNVNGACQYAQQYYDVLSRRDNNLEDIYDSYMNPPSYNTYATDCHEFVSQPPSISIAVIENALNASADLTDRYVLHDTAVVGNATPKFFNDQDRNNYYLEAATKYIQQSACTSKRTTSMYLSTLQLEKFKSFTPKVACEGGHIKYPKCNPSDPYRSLDGSCNNLKRPLDGQARDCMLRLLPADYKDGVSEFRTSRDGPLPNARVISTNLLGEDDRR